jgi:deazaflavin-dependent oxidoreductase (nitroreductase family)
MGHMADKQIKPFTKRQEAVANAIVKPMTRLNIWAYRATGGRIGGRFLHGAPVLLLTTTGRRSGRPRTVALIYLSEGEDLVVVASKAGMAHHPTWYLNLEANPEVEVELGRDRQQMIARRASDEEKAALWPRLLEVYPDYEDYQARTARNIPVVILSPR